MSKATVIFGNGLGMALDPQFFTLRKALENAWAALDESERLIITTCAKKDGSPHSSPYGEDHLNSLQKILTSCETIKGILDEDSGCILSSDGSRFPHAARRFVTRAAWYFHKFDFSNCTELQMQQFGQLMDSLEEVCASEKWHVMTLNYDTLLYKALIERDVLNGYNGPLLDGFLQSSGFRPVNLESRYGKSHGLFLHLHGSPLFYDDKDGAIKKYTLAEAKKTSDELVGSHVVLTHQIHKPTVIASSSLLFSYWQRMQAALQESARVYLFGYSGDDIHINNVIRTVVKQDPSKEVIIVEWDGRGSAEDRKKYWVDCLNRGSHDESSKPGWIEPRVELLSSILGYQFAET